MATATPAPSETEALAARRSDLRAALARTLTEVDADQRLGPRIGATQLRMRLEFTDLAMALNVTAAESGHNLSWSFADDPGWQPKLLLRMSSAVANRYLQGRESLAIAIAHGEVRCVGESRVALRYLPATRLLREPYRRVVEAEFPALAMS